MLLQINKLNIKNIKEERLLVKDLSFILNKNDKIAIVGDEGNGKSTLLKAIYDSSLIDYCQVTGEIKKYGKIGYLEQDILSKWKDYKTLDYLLIDNIGDDINYEMYDKLANLNKLLNDLAFSNESFSENKYMYQYSGGEIIKLGLIKILLYEPDIIFLDEPSNDLDFKTILFLEEFILNREEPILYVSHDQKLLENTSNAIIHLHQIKKKQEPVSVFMNIPYCEYIENRLTQIEKQQMIAKKQRNEYVKKMERFRQIYQTVEHQQNQVVRDPVQGRLLKKKIHLLKSQEKRFEKEKENFLDIPQKDEFVDLFFNKEVLIPNGKKVLNLEIDELRINENILSRNIKLEIVGPQKIAFIGKNGIGKTTLIKNIYNQLRDRKDINVGYMSQKYEDVLDENKTALETLLLEPDKEKEAIIRKIMGSALFTREEMLYKTSQLSGGQKAKLLLLKLIINECNVILLDEPTRNISPINSKEIYRLLNEYNGCIIAISHDRTFLEEVFDDVYELTKEGLVKK